MKKTIAFAVLAALAASASYGALGEVLASWEVPLYSDMNGITFEGEYIWLKYKIPQGEDKRVLKCTKTGSIVSRIALPYPPPVFYSRGLAFDGEYLWTVYEYWHIPYYDSFRKYTTTGSYAGGFAIHVNYGPQSEAVAWDGQYLYTDETSPRPYRIGKYTTAGTLVATFPMTVGVGSDMAYYKRQLWYYGGGGLVYGVTLNGSVVASFAAPGGSCAGTAFDGEYLWTADRNTPQYIYKVDIDVVDVAPASVGRVKAIFR
jgi:hypothetical protein